jgi:hypothetical protein
MGTRRLFAVAFAAVAVAVVPVAASADPASPPSCEHGQWRAHFVAKDSDKHLAKYNACLADSPPSSKP